MDSQDRVEKKLDKILEHISSLDVTVGKQQVSIDEHIRRTNLLESEVRPIKRHVDMVNGALKLIAGLGAVKLITMLWPKP